ncbi:hemicentin-1 [Papilio machaon]|uniref:hemicentin-1 n=1 Tax=Papilio machaon TaxID=76193 RepID=UPI001E6650FE|nr:hemicentin-1 [Papilio machaon]
MLIFFGVMYLSAFVTANEYGKKSFTIVLDTTISMREEIDIIKSNIESVVKTPLFDIDNYILVPFDDPGCGPPIILKTPSKLVEVVNIVEVSGGNECPENSLPAIEQALTASKANSMIFVFTDGYASNNSKLNSIENLCRSTNSQVIILLSGKCVPSGTKTVVGTIDAYFDVAKACSGSVIQLQLNNFRQVFRMIKEISKTDWTEIVANKVGPEQFTISIDGYTKDVVMTVTGEYPNLEILDDNGQTPVIDRIVNTLHSKVIRLISPTVGIYTVKIFCQGKTLVTIYKRREVNFRLGFSPKLARSMKETTNLPLPGKINYISIAIAEISIELKSIYIKLNGRHVKKVDVEIVDRSLGLYSAQEYFEPETSFKITIYGHDQSYQVIKGSTGSLTTQKLIQELQFQRPKIEWIEPKVALVEYKANITLACKVSGYPKPNISWSDDTGLIFPSEDALLETRSVFISYAYIDRITENSTIHCKAESSEGEDTLTMYLYVNRTLTFEVIEYPQDATFEYSQEGQLFCKVDAYPDASIQWYHNDSLVENSDNLEIIPDQSMLLLKNMTPQLTGEYRCEISNNVQNASYTAIVDISGVEIPEIELKDSELVLRLDDWVNVECTINKGKPAPKVNWKFKTENGYEEIPEGVSAEENHLKIPSVKTEHIGIYKCEAENIFGSDSKELLIKVEYPPKIKFYDKLKIVRLDEDVELSCEVDAIPKAEVKWEKKQDDIIIPLDSRHETDEWNTLRFTASSIDSGNYYCIAENYLGRAERIVTLNVLVPPYIDPPPRKIVTIRAGESITLQCHVHYGHPVPSTKWEFIALNSTLTTLLRGSSINDLTLNNVSKSYEGSYICLAENMAGSDTIKIDLKIF